MGLASGGILKLVKGKVIPFPQISRIIDGGWDLLLAHWRVHSVFLSRATP